MIMETILGDEDHNCTTWVEGGGGLPRTVGAGGSCPYAVLMSSTSHASLPAMVAVVLLECLRSLLAPAVLSLISLWLWRLYIGGKRDGSSCLPLPPGDFGIPLLGETLYLLLFSDRYFKTKRTKYGNIYKTHLLGKPTIRVIGPENVKQILRGENTIVETKWPTSTNILLGEGCLSHASGSDHVTKKRSIMKAFTFSALSGYVPVIQSVTRQYIRRWCRQQSIMGYPEFKMLTFDLSCRLLAGFQMDLEECKRLMDVFEVFTSNIFSIPVDLPGSGFRKGLTARETLLEKIDDVMTKNETLQHLEHKGVLKILMDDKCKDKLTKKELKNLCLELLFAGHGTTSSAACFLVYELAKHPEVTKKIQAEMTSVGLSEVGSASDLDFELLNKMSYLNNVVKESLRLCPPIGGGYRKALQTFEINGFQVPKGWTVTYSIRDTHKTDTLYSDPDKFDPDRWTQSTHTAKHPFQYIPFGGGRRACAGKELAKLMLKIFVLELVRGSDWRLQNPDTKFSTFPVPTPTDSLPLRFSARSDDFRIRAHTW